MCVRVSRRPLAALTMLRPGSHSTSSQASRTPGCYKPRPGRTALCVHRPQGQLGTGRQPVDCIYIQTANPSIFGACFPVI